MFDRGIPSICYAQGLTYFRLTFAERRATHSGSFGGAVSNPAFVLAQVLAQMKDQQAREDTGFYDDVRPLSDAERAEWKKLPFNETSGENLGAFGENVLSARRVDGIRRSKSTACYPDSSEGANCTPAGDGQG